jgi:methionine synthase I (cobalamin-dependent)
VNEFLAVLRSGEAGPLVLDGGLGSMLIAKGLAAGQAPEAWVLERPDEVAAVHRAYVEAGSDAVHTCTFGATPIRLKSFGLADDCERINRGAVELARQAAARYVIGDVGPTGEYLPPVGAGDEQAWAEAFRAQGRALAAAGVDALHVETMSDLNEAMVALTALREVAPDIPLLVSLTFDRNKRGFFTVMGNPVVAALEQLAAGGADGVGANCSITSEVMRELVDVVRDSSVDRAETVPLCVQANAGQPRITAEGVAYDQSPQEFAADTAEMVRLGARAVGGCCGTDPTFISALCLRLDELGLRGRGPSEPGRRRDEAP